MERTKVLFVDDDTMVGDMVTIGLRHLGFETLYISACVSICTVINEFRPNIVILDVEIGDKNGVKEAEAIHAHFPYVPIIFVSSHSEPTMIERAINLCAAAYIKKPFSIEELAAYINRYATQYNCNMINIGDCAINCDTRELRNTKSGNVTKLSNKEFSVMQILIENRDLIVPRKDLSHIVSNGAFSTDQMINNLINSIRAALRESDSVKIELIRGVGYKLVTTTHD